MEYWRQRGYDLSIVNLYEMLGPGLFTFIVNAPESVCNGYDIETAQQTVDVLKSAKKIMLDKAASVEQGKNKPFWSEGARKGFEAVITMWTQGASYADESIEHLTDDIADVELERNIPE